VAKRVVMTVFLQRRFYMFGYTVPMYFYLEHDHSISRLLCLNCLASVFPSLYNFAPIVAYNYSAYLKHDLCLSSRFEVTSRVSAFLYWLIHRNIVVAPKPRKQEFIFGLYYFIISFVGWYCVFGSLLDFPVARPKHINLFTG